MSLLVKEFKYELGDLVVHVTDTHRTSPTRFIVIKRIAQECPGGIQEKYLLRTSGGTSWALTGAALSARHEALEIELVPAPPVAE